MGKRFGSGCIRHKRYEEYGKEKRPRLLRAVITRAREMIFEEVTERGEQEFQRVGEVVPISRRGVIVSFDQAGSVGCS